MNQDQKEAIAREISYVEDDLARCKRQRCMSGDDPALNERIERQLRKLVALKDNS